MKQRILLEDFISFCRGKNKVRLTRKEKEAIERSRNSLESLAAHQAVYGVNTGIGSFFREKIAPDFQAEYQRNLILSHAVGVGRVLDRETSRGVLFLLINMLRKGHSGVTPELVRFLIDLFNQDIIPAIPEQGSVGASGDLAPLAHIASALIGEGAILSDSTAVPTKFSFPFERGKIKPIALKPGEGIALINGTHFITSILARTVYEADILSRTADVIAALTFSVLRGNIEIFDQELQNLRPSLGQRLTADTIKAIIRDDGSSRRLQDAYSLRCISQVHGTVKEAIWYAKKIVEREINSVTGNPIYVGYRVIHGGNFHGQPLAQAADFLCIALSTLANISERRTEKILNPGFSGLPPFLAQKPGLDSGLMVAQYTAASLVSENKTLSHPASVDSIPLACGQEDFVSMGAWASRAARQVCKNSRYVLAIELLAVFLALDFCSIEAARIRKIHSALKEILAKDQNKIMANSVETLYELIYKETFLKICEEAGLWQK